MSFKFSRILSVSALLISVFIVQLPAKAEKVCQVTDPTGTPLNVRVTPNGKIINTLRNGREVNVEEIAYDSQGRPWAKVSGYYKNRYRVWGWVFREFISCYER
jgi:Bacterial SH3 domain